jgi:hypothetical protein
MIIIPHVHQLYSKELEKLLGKPRNPQDVLNSFSIANLAALCSGLPKKLFFICCMVCICKTQLNQVCIAGGVAQKFCCEWQSD